MAMVLPPRFVNHDGDGRRSSAHRTNRMTTARSGRPIVDTQQWRPASAFTFIALRTRWAGSDPIHDLAAVRPPGIEAATATCQRPGNHAHGAGRATEPRRRRADRDALRGSG